jgi:protein TonB
MYDIKLDEPGAELEQALYAALAREVAPADLIARVEARLLNPQPAPAIPTFRMLSLPPRSLWTSLWSIAAHAAVLAVFALLLFAGRKQIAAPNQAAVMPIDVKPFIPMTMKVNQSMGGGGGGGAHELVEASKGHLPKMAKTQITPSQIIRNDHPKLAVDPTIVMPQQIKLPDAPNMPNVGVPQSPQIALASQGGGSGSGFGSGRGGGIGSGNGNGVGPGEGGGYGGGVMRPGGGVSAPHVIFSVDPEFSDEARRAKYQGICLVSLIVDAQGNPQHVRVVRPLGMGLDEKAVEAVRQYKFKPAYYQGHPVAVELNVEVNFRIY